MTRFLWWLIGIPVGIILVTLAVANRKSVTVSLDPFQPDAPALSFALPLFLLFFSVLMTGVLLGGCAVWLNQGRHRKAERRWREEADRLRWERERTIERDRETRRASLAALPAPSDRRAA
ncbi:lipopolysaccharide assembly protein LapA domain-containing protein [Prosthecomicrobium sp. N25]|uniref:lipopolysaccharide assembly protein LapA domain-containing protein n=1 Tax=Prosthecomicrobium sp. N25 TaxID=3129254 RepID=UPI0030781067